MNRNVDLDLDTMPNLGFGSGSSRLPGSVFRSSAVKSRRIVTHVGRAYSMLPTIHTTLSTAAREPEVIQIWTKVEHSL